MNTELIDQIHEQYNNYMEGQKLEGSYSVFVPFFKVNLKVSYIYQSVLNVIEEYLCKCIALGVNDREKICKVLAISDDIFNFTVENLIDNNYLKKNTDTRKGTYSFTDAGSKLFRQNLKLEPKVREVEVFYDGLNPEYKIEFFGNEVAHKFIWYDDVIKTKPSESIILPETSPTYEGDRDKTLLATKIMANIDLLNKNYEEAVEAKKVVDITSFELSSERKIIYHEYRILVYRDPKGRVNMLAHDPCGLNYVDSRVTQSILNLHNEGKFTKILGPSKDQDKGIADFVLALKEYALNNVKQEENQEPEALAAIEELKEKVVVTKYIMNFHIRQLFLKYLKEAEKSLYIISPWMNNHVVNNKFIADLKKLMEKGVKVRIICGIADAKEKLDFRNKNTIEIAGKLCKEYESFGDLFRITCEGQTHEKLLICDEKYYINGSFNFLSYAGEDETFFRNEGSTYSEDRGLILNTIKVRFRNTFEE